MTLTFDPNLQNLQVIPLVIVNMSVKFDEDLNLYLVCKEGGQGIK